MPQKLPLTTLQGMFFCTQHTNSQIPLHSRVKDKYYNHTSSTRQNLHRQGIQTACNQSSSLQKRLLICRYFVCLTNDIAFCISCSVISVVSESRMRDVPSGTVGGRIGSVK